jgi:hypothetical protein
MKMNSKDEIKTQTIINHGEDWNIKMKLENMDGKKNINDMGETWLCPLMKQTTLVKLMI